MSDLLHIIAGFEFIRVDSLDTTHSWQFMRYASVNPTLIKLICVCIICPPPYQGRLVNRNTSQSNDKHCSPQNDHNDSRTARYTNSIAIMQAQQSCKLNYILSMVESSPL